MNFKHFKEYIIKSQRLVYIMISGLLIIAVQNASAADLADIFALAETNDALVRQARARYEANHTLISQGRSALLPALTLQGSTTRNAQAPTAQYSYADGFNSHGYGLNLTQNLVNFQAWYAFNSAKISDQAASVNLARAEQDLILRVAAAYFSVLRNQENLASFIAEEEAAARILEQSRQSLEVGLNTVTDVLQSQSNNDLARVNRLLAENVLAQSLEALQVITGSPVSELEELDESFPVLTPETESMAEWEQTALSANLALQTAELEFAASQEDVRSASAAMYPTFDISANYNYNAESSNPFSFFENTASERASIALNVTVPLYSGGLNRARKRQAYYNRNATEEQMLQTRRETLQGIHNAWRNLLTDVVTVSARQQAVESATNALQSTEAGAQAGTRNIVDVVLAQRTLFQTQRDYANARYDYVLNTLNLKQAAGILSPVDVLELNEWMR